jgi:hypothetical protein
VKFFTSPRRTQALSAKQLAKEHSGNFANLPLPFFVIFARRVVVLRSMDVLWGECFIFAPAGF